MSRLRLWLLQGLGVAACGGFASDAKAQTFHRTRPAELNGIPCYDYQWGERPRGVSGLASGVLLERPVADAVRAFRDLVQDETLAAVLADRPRTPVPVEAPMLRDADRSPEELPSPREVRDGSEQDHDRAHPERPTASASSALPRAMAAIAPARALRLFQLERTHLGVDHCAISNVAVQLHRDGLWVLSLRADQNPTSPDGIESYRPRLHVRRNAFQVRLRCYGFYGATTSQLPVGRPVLADLHPVEFMVEREVPKHIRMACCDPRVARYFDMIDRIEIEFTYQPGLQRDLP